MKLLPWLALFCIANAPPASAQEVSAALRQGVYTDTDHTQVLRSLATVDAALSCFHLSAALTVDRIGDALVVLARGGAVLLGLA